MNLTQLLLILYARRGILLGTLVVTMMTTYAVTLMLPKSYQATTTMVMNFKSADPVTGNMMAAQLLPGYMATQLDIIQSKNVGMRVVDALKMTSSPAVQEAFQQEMLGKGDIRDWLATALLKNLKVVPSRESSVIDLMYSGSDPQFAAAVANAFAAEYQKAALQLRVQPLRQASVYFAEQMQGARDNLEQAQSRLSKFQQEKGLVSVDNRLDVETSRLNDLSSQLVAVQGQLADAQSRQRAVSAGNPAEAPDVMSNPLIQNLKSSLVQAEARFSDIASKLDTNHPTYQGAKAEVDKIRGELNAHVALTSSSVVNGARMLSGREAEMRSSLEKQKAKVLELNRSRDEMAVLMRDVESAQRAYDALMARANQTNLEGQSNQTDVAILSPALAPVSPSSPRMSINMALSVILGVLLGGGASVLIELLDRRIRSREDLQMDADVPFLGSFAENRPVRKKGGRMFGLFSTQKAGV